MQDLGTYAVNVIISLGAGIGGGWMTLKITQAVQEQKIKTLFRNIDKLEIKVDKEKEGRDKERTEVHEILDKIKEDTAFIKGKLDK